MNPLAELIDALDLDEGLVMRRLKQDGLVPDRYWRARDVPVEACEPALELVIKVISE